MIDCSKVSFGSDRDGCEGGWAGDCYNWAK